MRKVYLGALIIMLLLMMSSAALAQNPAQKVTMEDTSVTPDAKYWFPHYLLAPGSVSWTDYNSGHQFTIDYPPGQPTFNVTTNMQILSSGIVRSGSTTWKGDIWLAVETYETIKYNFQWWPYVNIPGSGLAKVPYKVKWVGEPWDNYGYWRLLGRLDP